MRLSFDEKLVELEQKSLELGCFPVMHRNDRPEEKNEAKFSDGVDMGAFIARTMQDLKNDKLSEERAAKFRAFLLIKEKFSDKEISKKLEEARIICDDCGYLPVSQHRVLSEDDNRTRKFSDGGDVGYFFDNCKAKIKNGTMNKQDADKVNAFLESVDTYKLYRFKTKIKEIKKIIRERGFVPAHNQKIVNKNKTISFSNGKDMGHFITKNREKYKNGTMPENYRKIWEEFIDYSEKVVVIYKMHEIFEVITETNTIPINGSGLNPKHPGVYKFKDGTDMGAYISRYRSKITKGTASKFEQLLFQRFLRIKDSVYKETAPKKNQVKEKSKNLSSYG